MVLQRCVVAVIACVDHLMPCSGEVFLPPPREFRDESGRPSRQSSGSIGDCSVIAVLGVWGNGVVGLPDRRRRRRRENGDGIHVLSGQVHISGSAADTRMLAAPRREEQSCPALSLFLVNSWK